MEENLEPENLDDTSGHSTHPLDQPARQSPGDQGEPMEENLEPENLDDTSGHSTHPLDQPARQN